MPRAVALVMMLLAMAAWSAQARAADDRRLLDHCKTLVAQAQPQASTASEDGELRRAKRPPRSHPPSRKRCANAAEAASFAPTWRLLAALACSLSSTASFSIRART